MKNKLLTIVSVSLAMVMTLGMFSGCSKGGSNKVTTETQAPVFIEESSEPFYTCDIVRLSDIKKEDASYVYVNTPFFYDGKYYVPYSWEPKDNEDCCYNNYSVRIYDLDGNELEDRDLTKDLAGKKELEKYKNGECTGFYLDSEQRYGSKIMVSAYKSSNDSYESESFTYDFVTGELGKFPYETEGEEYISESVELPDGRLALLTSKYDEKSAAAYTVVIINGDKIEKKIDLTKDLKAKKIEWVYDLVFAYGKLTLNGFSSDESFNISVDFTSGDVKIEEAQNTSAADEMYNKQYCGDTLYAINEKGMYKINDDGSQEEEFLFENGNILRSKVMDSRLEGVYDDKYVFSGSEYVNDKSRAYILTVRKLDKNPNVGKELIELVSLDYLDAALDEAIVKFNNESDKCFIKVVTKYETDYDIYNDVDYSDDEAMNKANAEFSKKQSDLMNQIAIDIIAGDAPDIIVDAHNCAQLLDENYLIDLSSFVDSHPNKGDFFTNIIDGSKKDGKLYYMPLTFSISSMSTAGDLTGKDGFTFDEFKDFVKNECNGVNPVNEYCTSKIDAVEYLFDNEADLFFKDGKIDLDNDEFKALASYVNDNITEYNFDEVDYDQFATLWDSGNEICSVYNFENYCNSVRIDNKTDRKYCGIPSSDGRGPQADIEFSVSISASSGSQESALEFLNTISNEKYMQDLADSYSITLNKKACVNHANAILDDMNEVSLYCCDDEDANLRDLSDKDITNFVSLIEGASVSPACDPAIITIIREEMPGYFSGQRSIDEVIGVINDRAQTVLDEKS